MPNDMPAVHAGTSGSRWRSRWPIEDLRKEDLGFLLFIKPQATSQWRMECHFHTAHSSTDTLCMAALEANAVQFVLVDRWIRNTRSGPPCTCPLALGTICPFRHPLLAPLNELVKHKYTL
jgi:hypothetical protein